MILTTSFYDINQINKKRLFPKFLLIPIFLRLQLMHDMHAYWHCSIDYCVKLTFVNVTLCKNCFYFTLIYAEFLWGNVLLGRELQTDSKTSNFDIFENALYMESGSIP